MNGNVLLLLLIIVGMLGRSHIITMAACILLIVKLISLERFFPAIERRGLELGLLFLTMGVLVPFANEKITLKDVAAIMLTPAGIIALLGGAIASYLNSRGLDLLKLDPQLVVGLIIGSIIGIVCLRGIPVGPLMAAGITAILLKALNWLLR